MGFEERNAKSERIIINHLESFFNNDRVEIKKFGVESLVMGEEKKKELSDLTKNYNDPKKMRLEYLPDFVINYNGRTFLLEAKVSTTPCWSKTRIKDANDKHDNRNIHSKPSINFTNCGEIAREPFLAYRKYFPETILLYVTNYNKNLVLAQYAKDIECLRCEKNIREKVDCNECPLLKENGFFDSVERNSSSSGSQTPSTNINLDSFLPAKEFFKKEFNLDVNVEEIKKAILSEKLSFGTKCCEESKKKIIAQIWNSGTKEIKCIECGGRLVEKKGSNGRMFLGCSNYWSRNCKFTVSLFNPNY